MEVAVGMTRGDLDAGKNAVRAMIDNLGYGDWVSDEQCEDFARVVIEAVDKHRMVINAQKPKPQ